MDKIRLLIDTDLGDDVDDAAALRLILRSEVMEIVGVTTVFGDTKKRAEMVREMFSLYGKDHIPVTAGYGRALVERELHAGEAPIQYSLLKTTRPSEGHEAASAEDFIIQMVKEHEELVILAMGAMTNLALAFLKEPELMKHVKIIGMGGAFYDAKPEWNIACDPEAARIVLEGSENLVLMGLDVTRHLKISEKQLEQWRAEGGETMEYFLEGVELFRKATGYPVTFHDVLLPAYLLDEQVVSLKKGDYTVELCGRLTRGTMVNRSNYYETEPAVEKNFYFAETVDMERFHRILDRYF